MAKQKTNFYTFFFTWAIIFLVITMLIWPEKTYQGALYGLELWANVLVPSLLPFFIITEIMFNLGIIRFLGILLEPLMRPLFNLPGEASFVLAMGFSSGFPMGAVLTKRLYELKGCSRCEAERLIAFTNNASPLFLMSAVAIGIFRQPSLGPLLLISHYLANLLIGILLGLVSRFSLRETNFTFKQQRLLLPSEPFSQFFSTAITNGINTICLIGGFVISYAVLIKILETTSLLHLCAYPFSLLLQVLHFDPSTAEALATGFWEMTLGINELSLTMVPLQEKIILTSILLGWCGLSIHSQVSGVLNKTGIKTTFFHQTRILHSILAGLISYVFIQKGNWFSRLSLPALTPPTTSTLLSTTFLFNLFYLTKIFILFFLILFSLAGTIFLSSKLLKLIKLQKKNLPN